MAISTRIKRRKEGVGVRGNANRGQPLREKPNVLVCQPFCVFCFTGAILSIIELLQASGKEHKR
jgi:hypothetical protein